MRDLKTMLTIISRVRSGRPLPGEFAEYAADDIARVSGDDALFALAEQRDRVLALLSPLDDHAVDGVTYAPGKWTLKDVLAHLADDERVFGYRMLCLARRDTRTLTGFDEREYVEAAAASHRPWSSLLADYAAVRQATLALLDGLPASAWEYRGIVNGYEASVRGLAFHIAGHELRHLRAIETSYWARLNRQLESRPDRAPQLHGLDHVQLAMPVGAEDRAREFYGRVLGLPEIPKPAALAVRGGAWFGNGEVELHLGVEPEFRPARKAHPAIRVDDLDALAAACRAAGHAPQFDTAIPGTRRFHVDDPFGNRLEFVQRPVASPVR